MKKLYRISHNISALLKESETESVRYFADLEAANALYVGLRKRIDYMADEYIALDEVEVYVVYGEYQIGKEVMLRYDSDNTKIGVMFDIKEYQEP